VVLFIILHKVVLPVITFESGRLRTQEGRTVDSSHSRSTDVLFKCGHSNKNY